MTLPPKVLAWWRLLRVANVFTAVSNVVAGYLFCGGNPDKPERLITACIASALIYLGGMVLNDVLDYDVDCAERPERPLPSGAIGRRAAATAVFLFFLSALLVVGCVDLGLALGAGMLIVYVCLYDYTKTLPRVEEDVPPVLMGLCRFSNILLGGFAAEGGPDDVFRYASVVATYTMGITWFAQTENKEGWGPEQTKGYVAIASAAVLLPILLLPNHVVSVPKADWVLWWAALVAVLAKLLLDVRRDPQPETIRNFVGWAVLGFIPFDALVCLAVAGWGSAAVVLFLVVPTLLLARVAPMS